MKVVPLDQGYHNSLGESLKGDAAEDILSPEFSEDRLALRFADRHGKDLRYVAAWGNGLLGPAHIGRSKTRSPSLIWPQNLPRSCCRMQQGVGIKYNCQGQNDCRSRDAGAIG